MYGKEAYPCERFCLCLVSMWMVQQLHFFNHLAPTSNHFEESICIFNNHTYIIHRVEANSKLYIAQLTEHSASNTKVGGSNSKRTHIQIWFTWKTHGLNALYIKSLEKSNCQMHKSKCKCINNVLNVWSILVDMQKHYGSKCESEKNISKITQAPPASIHTIHTLCKWEIVFYMQV